MSCLLAPTLPGLRQSGLAAAAALRVAWQQQQQQQQCQQQQFIHSSSAQQLLQAGLENPMELFDRWVARALGNSRVKQHKRAAAVRHILCSQNLLLLMAIS
jgi:hypothetical protein